MEEAQKQVKDYIQGNQSDAAKFLQRVVQEGSVRGKESSAQAVIIEKCRELGMNMDIWELGGQELTNHPAFCSDRNNFVGNPNAVGVLPGTGGGRSLILNGHIDVVPVGDIDSWEYEPFSGRIENGRLYGRGSTDMKGGTVSLLLALEAIIKSGITLKGDVIFQSVIEEESGGAGTLSTVLRGYKADGAIIPEPTNMKFFPKQQGSMWFRIKIRGKQAHGGTRYEGVSAIEKAELILKEIRELETKRNNKITDPLFSEIPIPIPINVGKISSGDWPSSVPDIAMIEGRMGVAPDESMENAKQEMEKAIQKVASLDPWLKLNQPVVEWFGARWLPGDIEVEHDLVTVLTESFTEIKGTRPVIEASPWATDGGILNKIGGVPVVVFGPGITKMAHDANEYIKLKDVYEVAEIIAVAIMKWCGTVNDGT